MSAQEPPALYFHPDMVEAEGKDLVGRRSAGSSFVKGFLQHVSGAHINLVAETARDIANFKELAEQLGSTREIRADQLRGQKDFTRSGTIFFPGPGYMNAAWRRLRFGSEKCSLVGVTHTVSTRRIIEGIHRLLNEPVEAWDAIICTSHAVRSVVQKQFETEAEFMRMRYGATRVPQPSLPVIPLGIETSDFSKSESKRGESRQKYGVGSDDIVILTVGRWTVNEKANPVPMFLALEQVAKSSGKKIHLWMAGWSSRDEEEKMHRQGAASYAPSVTTRMIDGRDPWARSAVWSGADIFTLPVDNIQETFGLVPVEAMAAGLPVVMPDWNGFKDTVRHGETGFLVPTRMANTGFGKIIASRFADGTDDYIHYLSMVAQQTQIDIDAYAEALGNLVEDPSLRAKMGAAGVERAKGTYDLGAVIPQYEKLAEELADQRQSAEPTTRRLNSGPMSPVEIDPLELYRAYPTSALAVSDMISVRKPLSKSILSQLDRLNGRELYQRRIVADELVLQLHALLSKTGPQSVETIARATKLPLNAAESAILFLSKFGFVNITPNQP